MQDQGCHQHNSLLSVKRHLRVTLYGRKRIRNGALPVMHSCKLKCSKTPMPYLQRPLQLCEGLLPLLLRCASRCASLAPPWMLTGREVGAIGLGGLFRRWRPPTSQCSREEARIKQKLQHTLLCDCPVQGTSQLQRLPAAALKA